MRTKILVLSLVAATLSIMTSTGTLAYLMDTASSESVFTTGQVKIRNNTSISGTCENMTQNDTCAKTISATNTGTVDAFVRLRILVPTSLLTGSPPAITISTATDEFTVNDIMVDEVSYKEYTSVWSDTLAAGSTTTSKEFSITYNLETDTTASTEGENTESVSAADLANLGIKIYTEAIQAQGFNDATDAFNHFNS